MLGRGADDAGPICSTRWPPPRGPGADAPRLHRQRRPRAADAADEPPGLPRGAARRRHRGRSRDLRVALRGGRAARPAVALARRARRGRRRRPRRRARRASTWRPRSGRALDLAQPALDRAGRTPLEVERAADRCPPGPTPTTSPRCSRTCSRTPSATRPRRRGHGPGRAPTRRRAGVGREHRRADPGRRPARVFERFYRVEKSRDRARGGAGIGLAIVKQLVEAGGGRVGAESADGQTRFWFSLPG